MSRLPAPRFLDRATPPHLATLILLIAVSAMAMNVFLPSLPSMAAWFGVDYGTMQWSVTIYLAGNAVLQLVIGPVSDRFGRRPVLIWSLVLFLIATLGTLVAPTAETFLACRLGQSVIVSTMVLSRAVVRDMVPQDQAASMIGYVTMGMAVVPLLAPLVGGLLDGWFGWQANFVLLLVAGAAMLALTWADLGETAPLRASSFREQVAQYPALLTSRRFWGYCATAAFASGVFFAFLGGAAFVGAEVYGLGPAQIGLAIGTPAAGYALGNWVSGRYAVRLGVNRMIVIGTLATLGGLAVQAGLVAAGLAPAWVFFGLTTTVGFGNGMVLPSATAGMLSVRPHLAGTASGLGGAMMIGGGAALSALAGALLVPGSGPWPLLWLMLGSAAAAVVAILYVIRRERQLG